MLEPKAGRDSKLLNDVGVLSDSIRFYHSADDFTAANLYHIPHAGIYHCGRQYEVERAYLDVCQIILVDRGELGVEYRRQKLSAAQGQIVLLDCREPHRYYARSDDLRMRWFHFVGNSSIAYTQLILQTHGFVLTVFQNPEIEASCRNIMMAVKEAQPNPHMLSATISQLLAQLVLLLGEPKKGALEQTILDSVKYIEAHYADRELSVEELARRTALSTCYYMRKFKTFQSTTPHQFLQATRLRAAKHMLMTTSHSIEEVADSCGFYSSSHFIMAFRKNTGLTPLQFRTRWR